MLSKSCILVAIVCALSGTGSGWMWPVKPSEIQPVPTQLPHIFTTPDAESTVEPTEDPETTELSDTTTDDVTTRAPTTTRSPTTTISSFSTTAPPSCEYCGDHGTPNCQCEAGWRGKRCDEEIDYCQEPVISVESHPAFGDLCSNHSFCRNVEEPERHAECICDEGWEGVFCDKTSHNGTWIETHRCYAFDPVKVPRKPEVPIGCLNLIGYECAPDDLNCFYGKSSPKCIDPIGWCVPADLKQLRVAQLNQFKMK